MKVTNQIRNSQELMRFSKRIDSEPIKEQGARCSPLYGLRVNFRTCFNQAEEFRRIQLDSEHTTRCKTTKNLYSLSLTCWRQSILVLLVQNGVLRAIVNAAWFIQNDEIHDHLKMPTVTAEIDRHKTKHKNRLSWTLNPRIPDLLDTSAMVKQLKRGHVL